MEQSGLKLVGAQILCPLKKEKKKGVEEWICCSWETWVENPVLISALEKKLEEAEVT